MLVLQGHTSSVQALAYTPDGATLISAGDDWTIRLWDVRGGQQQAVLREHTDAVLTIAVSPNGKWLASGGHDKRVRVWDFPQRRLVNRRFPPFRATLNAVSIDPRAGRWLYCGADRRFRGVDRGNRDATRYTIDLETHIVHYPGEGLPRTTAVWSLAHAPNGDVATGWGSGAVTVEIGEVPWIRPPLQHPAAVTGLSFSPDGATLFALSANIVYVWDVQRGEVRRTIGPHAARISSVAVTPDGRFLLTGGWDATVRVWDAETGHEKARFDWQLGRRINAVAVAPDGMTAAAAGDAHEIVIWDLDDL